MKKIILLFVLSVSIFSCQKEGKKGEKHLPKSAGTINHFTIVTSNRFWKGEVGDVLRKVFATPVYGLPQIEPMFTLKQMEPKAFHQFVKKSRTFIQVEQNDTLSGIRFIKDLHATPQTGILVRGKNIGEIKALLLNNATKMRNTIKAVELAEKQRQIRKSPRDTKEIQETFGVDLDVLFSYRTAKKTKDFMWLRKDIKNGDLNLLIYQLPYNYIKRDSLTIQNIVKMRDSIGKAYIPGEVEGSYMITENKFSPFVTNTNIAKLPAIETRGVWDVKGDFMAGPFINYIVDDKVHNRLLVLEGFVYYPNSQKRDYVFELEAIIRSLKVK